MPAGAIPVDTGQSSFPRAAGSNAPQERRAQNGEALPAQAAFAADATGLGGGGFSGLSCFFDHEM